MKELFKLQRKNPFYELIVIIFGGLVYECIQLLGYGFDWYDIIATIIGGLVVSIYLFINKNDSICSTKSGFSFKEMLFISI